MAIDKKNNPEKWIISNDIYVKHVLIKKKSTIERNYIYTYYAGVSLTMNTKTEMKMENYNII